MSKEVQSHENVIASARAQFRSEPMGQNKFTFLGSFLPSSFPVTPGFKTRYVENDLEPRDYKCGHHTPSMLSLSQGPNPGSRLLGKHSPNLAKTREAPF